MGIIYWRDQLFKYQGPFDEIRLVQEVTLDDYLLMQFPPALMEKFPQQGQADREKICRKIQRNLKPRDSLWLWSISFTTEGSDTPYLERGGVAIKRGDDLVRIWQTWAATSA